MSSLKADTPFLCPDRIPAELKSLPNWVVWRYEKRLDKDRNETWTKVPYNPHTKGKADATDSADWGSFEQAYALYVAEEHGFDGIGCVIAPPYVGIDLDECIDTNTGEVGGWAVKVIDAINSYTETSPSETGVKIWTKAKPLPPIEDGGRRRTGKIEIYSKDRFFTITGNHYAGTPTDVADRSEEVERFYRETFAPPKPRQQQGRRAPSPPVAPDDRLVIEKVTAKPEYARLWSGDIGAYSSQSEADLAMVGRIAFFVGDDHGRIATIFGQSGLARDKWDREDYRTRTIAKALSTITNFYDWGGNGSGNGHRRPKGRTAEPGEDGAKTESESEGSWGEPIPLDSAEVPAFPAAIFCGWVGDMVGCVALSTETPLELGAMLAMSVLSAATQKKFSVMVKPDYFEPLCSYVAVAMDPGSRKSAVFARMVAPLKKWEKAKAAEFEPKIKEAESERKTLEGKIKYMRSKVEKIEDPEAFRRQKEEIAELEANLPTIPTAPILTVDDITVEHLGTKMSHNGEKLAVMSDEGGIFNIIAGMYNSNGVGNLDLILKGHSGSSVRVDRGSRPPVVLDHPALSIGVAVQPEVLTGLAQKPGFRGRGFLGRFWFCVPNSRLGYRSHETVPVPDRVAKDYEAAVTMLANIPPRTVADREVPYVLRLTPEALDVWQAYQHEVEAMMRPDGELVEMKDWAGKLPGAVARIAGLLHLSDFASCADSTLNIQGECMERAARFARFLVGHAIATFGMMGACEGNDTAKRLWVVIAKLKLPTFTARDAWHPLRGRYRRVADAEAGFRLLIDHNYIAELHSAERDKPGRPSRRFAVNPTVIAAWAE